VDIGALAAAFVLVFLAELGDKTQLAVLTLAADRRPIPVFIGASLALVLSTAIAVILGAVTKSHLSREAIRIARYGAGGLLVAFGVWTILRG